MPKTISVDKILGMFNVINEKLTNQDSKLDEIHDQTKKTNGRVSSLEDWRSQVVGGIKIASAVVLPVVLYMVYSFLKK